MKTTGAIVSVLMATLIAAGAAEDSLKSHGPEGGMILSLRKEAAAAIDRGKQWLLARQREDGHWSNPAFPALTALPVWALSMNDRAAYADAIEAGVEYILSCVHPYSGAIYKSPSQARKGGGLPNYNTAVCMVALHAVGDPDLVPAIRKAREFMAASQRLGDGIFAGGMGYDPSTGRDYTDLSNSYIAYEAMRLTENVEDLRGADEERVDLDWEAAREFIERCQNDPRFNERPWANPDPEERGGFAYHPDQTRAGTVTDEDGIVRFRSMPGMSYAGLLSYIYADVDRDDPRVQATIDWAVNHWSLDTATRDPAKRGSDAAREGLYYMLNVISKGLAAYGQDVFKPGEGGRFNWRIDMVEKLVGMQKVAEDGGGYWVNEVSRYWEGDKVLTTAYSLIALQIALGK